jgi:fructose/tagatose bisphosphate aldolase
MPLVSIASYLKRAQQEHFAVPLFDVEDSNCVDGVLCAAEECHAPVIIAMYARIVDLPNAPWLPTCVHALRNVKCRYR